MEKEDLEDVINIAYIFLEKSESESLKISYTKLQCMIYQSNKTYFNYKNELFYDINTVTSNVSPVNIDILAEFSSFRNKDYIYYTQSEDNKSVPIDLIKSIFLEYIWYQYSPMDNKEILDYTLKDIIFEHKSGIDITKDSFKNEKKDKNATNFMEFLVG